MDAILSKIKTGIEEYKKYMVKNYTFISDRIDPNILALAIAKIESNFDYKVKGKGGEYGLFQFTPSTLTSTLKSYTKNVTASQNLFYKYANSQTFVFMQLVYLNLKSLEAKGGKLNNVYEDVIKTLPEGTKKLVRLAILHNQGTSAITRQATNYNPLVFYVPQFLGAVKMLESKPNIASVATIAWEGASLVFPQLKVAGILTKLALLATTAYIGYNLDLSKKLTEIVSATNASYRQALQDRFKTIWLAKDSPEAKQINEDLKNEDHPLLNKPGSGSSNKPETPKKKIPIPSAGDVGKIIIATGTGGGIYKAVGEGVKDMLNKVGDTAKDIPRKVGDLLSNPIFLGAGLGLIFLISKKK
jgi:hypothetical protein